jgi:hypothetical protein
MDKRPIFLKINENEIINLNEIKCIQIEKNKDVTLLFTDNSGDNYSSNTFPSKEKAFEWLKRVLPGDIYLTDKRPSTDFLEAQIAAVKGMLEEAKQAGDTVGIIQYEQGLAELRAELAMKLQNKCI